MTELWLLFGSNDTEGGAHDFIGAYQNRQAAEDAGIDYWERPEPRLSSWMHLARLDLTTRQMQVIARLNIPGTEYAQPDPEDDQEYLEWLDYK